MGLLETLFIAEGITIGILFLGIFLFAIYTETPHYPSPHRECFPNDSLYYASPCIVNISNGTIKT
jgi:hypothetical protein